MKITLIDSETGLPNEVETDKTRTRKEKDEQYISFFKNFAGRIKNLEGKMEIAEVAEAKNTSRSIETLAIFVTLFTFISIEAQILRSGISFFSAIGFSIIMLAGLCFFLFSLHFFLVPELKWRFLKYSICLVFTLIVLFIGLFVIRIGEQEFYTNISQNYYSKQEADKIIEEKSSSNLETFKICILQNQGYWPCLK